MKTKILQKGQLHLDQAQNDQLDQTAHAVCAEKELQAAFEQKYWQWPQLPHTPCSIVAK